MYVDKTVHYLWGQQQSILERHDAVNLAQLEGYKTDYQVLLFACVWNYTNLLQCYFCCQKQFCADN